MSRPRPPKKKIITSQPKPVACVIIAHIEAVRTLHSRNDHAAQLKQRQLNKEILIHFLNESIPFFGR